MSIIEIIESRETALTVDELAGLLSASPKTLYKAIRIWSFAGRHTVNSIILTMEPKVVIERVLLRGAQHSDLPQQIATVYLEEFEYFVCAPPKATGHVMEWADHLIVRSPIKSQWGNAEITIDDPKIGGAIIRAVIEKIKLNTLDSDIWNWGNDSARWYPALICLHGVMLTVVMLTSPNNKRKSAAKNAVANAYARVCIAKLQFVGMR